MVSAQKIDYYNPSLEVLDRPLRSNDFIRKRDHLSPIFNIDSRGQIYGIRDLVHVPSIGESHFNIHHIIPQVYWSKDSVVAFDLINKLGIQCLKPYLRRNSILNRIVLTVELHDYINSMESGLTAHGGPKFIIACYIFVLFSMYQFASNFSSLPGLEDYLYDSRLSKESRTEIIDLINNAEYLLQNIGAKNRSLYHEIRSFYYWRKIQLIQAAREA